MATDIPGFGWVTAAWETRRFRQRPGSFDGVYPNFSTAARGAPKASMIGFNSAAMAELYRERLDVVFPCDYPMMFWLRPLLGNTRRIFDVGGHIGLAFYGYRSYLTFPDDLNWVVQDVPAVVDAGRALALERGADSLRFTSELEDAQAADVLIASGSLQYIEAPLASLLKRLTRPPAHLLLNKLPLTDGPSFVTLQNAVYAMCPYHVFNRTQFEDSFIELGYKVIDRWGDPERSCLLPRSPSRSVATYSGVYLRRDSSTVDAAGSPAA